MNGQVRRVVHYPSAHVRGAVHAGNKVLIEVVDNILLIVGDPQGILEQHLRHYPIHLLNICIIIILKYFIKFSIFKLPRETQDQR
jgi:hypothetical protein